MSPAPSQLNFGDRMTTHRWKKVRARRLSETQRDRVDAEVRSELLEMALRDMREAAGRTQQDVAELTSMTQSELSRFERREDHKVSTLRRYVEALGGELEVVAVIGNKRIALTGV